MNFKEEKGIALGDTIIAILILMVFSGLAISIAYNIYIQSSFIKRNDKATNYIVEIFEYAQSININELDSQKLVAYTNNKNNNEIAAIDKEYEITDSKIAPYSAFISVEDIYPNFVKKVEVTIMYKLGNKNKTVNMSTLIGK